ncbi:hypothetical protein Syun_021402 [Stephania yunnanensis]|uniref:Uncharacterized protein n=1 Tax=Stephania yunnanensis TaxID=152371 RepID=A0AAP0IG04_9MAGN
MPDNIKRNKRGEFWVAIVFDGGLLKKCVISNRTRNGDHYYGLADTLESSATKFIEKCMVLKELEDLGGAFQSITELNENVDGTLFLGSLSMPYVGIYEST